MDKKRICFFDFLKIVSASVIVAHHWQQYFGISYPSGVNFFDGAWYWGYLVELFCIMSGYLIFPYIRRIDEGLSFPEFYLKRISRLIPSCFFSVLFCAFVIVINRLLLGPSELTDLLTLENIAVGALGVQSGWIFEVSQICPPLWYVSVLMLLYMEFYILTYIGKRLSIPRAYLFAASIFFTASFFNQFLWTQYFPYRANGAFFAGLILANWHDRSKPRREDYIISGGIVLVFLSVAMFNVERVSAHMSYFLSFIVYPALITLGTSPKVNSLFRGSVWKTLGAISFDAFVWHYPLAILFGTVVDALGLPVDYSERKWMVVFILIAWAVAALVHYRIEKPAGKLLDKYFENRFFPEKALSSK